MSDLGTITNAANLEYAINSIWAGNEPLAALVPATRLITGRVPPSEQMPYVRLEPEAGEDGTRTSKTLYRQQPITFHVWSDTYDTGQAVAALIRTVFASIAFNWGTGGVLDMRWHGPPQSHQTNDPEFTAWETPVRFTAITWQTRED